MESVVCAWIVGWYETKPEEETKEENKNRMIRAIFL